MEISNNTTSVPPDERIVKDHPLQRHTTIGVGGAARYCFPVLSVGELKGAIEWARQRQLPYFLLGGGSNVVVSDAGFPGLVMHMEIKGKEIREKGTDVFLTVAAGEHWDYVAEMAVARGWTGVECLSGIPGQVGATPIQNVGAYGQQVSDTIVNVEALDVSVGKLVNLPGEQCGFGYRTSRFKTADRGRFIVTAVTFRLQSGKPPDIRYAELARHLCDQRVDRPTLAQVRGAVRSIRARKSMIVDPNDPNSRSCGSFFLNPVVDANSIPAIEERAREKGALAAGESLPRFDAGEARAKLSAAWLMEHAGLRRGMKVGRAGLSAKHILAIVNLGGAKAKDILSLAGLAKTEVQDKFGIELVPEPVFVGFSEEPD